MRSRRNMTLEVLAKKLGISTATISRALNWHTQHKVKARTLERILRLVKKYHYIPNISARNLVRQESNVIGVVIPHTPSIFFSEYYMQLLSGAADGMRESFYSFNLTLIPEKGEEKLRQLVRLKSLAGILVSHWTYFCDSIKPLEKLEIPVLGVNEQKKSRRVSFLTCDNFQGAKEAIEYLWERGHEKIGMLTGPRDSLDNRQRIKGYYAALQERGVVPKPNWLIGAERFERGSGYQAMSEMLKRNLGISAYFCANDEIAIGALKAIQEQGLRCPGEVSLIGFDGLKISEYVMPPITSVEQPIYEIAKEGVRLLIELIEGRSKGPILRKVPCRLIERNSVDLCTERMKV